MRAALKTNIPSIKSRMARVAWAVNAEFNPQITDALERSRANLILTTPRKTGKMAEGWLVRVIGGSAKGRTPTSGWVWNKYAEGSRWRYQSRAFVARARDMNTGHLMTPKVSEGGTRTVKTDGRTVLRVLEFGSQPHTIRAAHITKKGLPGSLHFVGAGGEDVFVKKVEHPGTDPHNMIRNERIALRMRVKRILKKVGRVPQKVMRGEIRG